MDEALARALAADLSTIVSSFNRLSELTLQIADEGERHSYRKSLGELMARCDHELIRPIAQKYPHLDPIKT